MNSIVLDELRRICYRLLKKFCALKIYFNICINSRIKQRTHGSNYCLQLWTENIKSTNVLIYFTGQHTKSKIEVILPKKDKKNENVQLPNGKLARRSFTDNSELFGHN